MNSLRKSRSAILAPQDEDLNVAMKANQFPQIALLHLRNKSSPPCGRLSLHPLISSLHHRSIHQTFLPPQQTAPTSPQACLYMLLRREASHKTAGCAGSAVFVDARRTGSGICSNLHCGHVRGRSCIKNENEDEAETEEEDHITTTRERTYPERLTDKKYRNVWCGILGAKDEPGRSMIDKDSYRSPAFM